MGEAIGAFSEEHASRLTGVSRSQLKHWDRTDFFRPSYSRAGDHGPFSRIYSFRDIVSLRVLNALRNEHGISLQHLKKVRAKLADLSESTWCSQRLYVLGKRVVFEEPATAKLQEVVSRQYVADIDLEVVIGDTRRAVREMNRRPADQIGRIVRSRFIQHNAPVIAGTRILARSIREYAEAGGSAADILKDYPDLTLADVEAALAYKAA